MLVIKRYTILLLIVFAFVAAAGAQAAARPRVKVPDLTRYEGRTVAEVQVVVEEAAVEPAIVAEFEAMITVLRGRPLSVIQVRESLQKLFDTGRIANARVEASDAAGAPGADGRPPVRVRFVVRPQVLVGQVRIEIAGGTAGTGVSEDEMRARLNLLEPGKRVSEQTLRANADVIQVYLRDRGYYRAVVEYEQQLDQTRTRSTITYRVALGAPATVEAFNIRVEGFNDAPVRPTLKLQTGAPFTQAALGDDVARVRRAIISTGRLAPRLDPPAILLDSARNAITVNLSGAVGPLVVVNVVGYELKEKTARELLPVKREGTIDPAAIAEGERRIRNRLQQEGYFFPDIRTVCAVEPPLPAPDPASLPPIPGESDTCLLVNPEEVTGRTVRITYEVQRGRRFRLADIRIEGTDVLSEDDKSDIKAGLRSKEATVLGIVPFLGYGRGYTSDEALEEDRRAVEARMRDLGYRRARATVRQGVSLEGEDLIITFQIEQGPLTRVASVETRGNKLFDSKTLLERRCPRNPLPGESCLVEGGAYSRSQARTDGERVRGFYARRGYLDSEVELDLVELARDPVTDDERVRLVYTVNEADKVFVNNIFVNGTSRTKKGAVLEAIPIHQGDVLRADRLAEAERILLSTSDAFRQVIIRTEPAGETASGYKTRDVIIDVEERKPIVTEYTFGFSTENGPLGGFEVRHANLFGQLRQGAFRSRYSTLQQLLRLEYFDPRFRRYGERSFAPLTLSLQYQRDTSVTRFFRSTIDRGSMGIVQRFNEEGKIVDEFGRDIREPSINRFTFNAETQRNFEIRRGPQGGELRPVSTLFLRYNYEDVRLFNIGSLLLAPVLRPDQVVRLSRLGATFARDTRDRQFDPTQGEFLTVDYALALKALGGNLSFSKLRVNYSRYYTVRRVRATTFAANVQLGLASLYGPTDRDGDGDVDEVDRRLPISERFFSGGSSTLRGFGFEEAGPRIVAPACNFGPVGTPNRCPVFFNQKGEPVALNPFTVPIGGNALAVVNLEARVGLTRSVQVVPFYDGGNVFQRVSDIFGRDPRPGDDPNLRAQWTHTVGLGFRVKTPFGTALGLDFGYLLNPPEFVVPQFGGATAILRAPATQIHFRFGQTF